MLTHYFKIGFRNLKIRKTQTFICAIGLSMGILAFSVCTYLTTLATKVNHQFPEYEQMAKLVPVNNKGEKWYAYPYREVLKLKEAQLPEIRNIVYGTSIGKQICTFQSGLEKEAVFETNCFRINEGIPEYYSMQPITGTIKEAFLQPQSVLISETMARKVYGKAEEALGKIVEVEEKYYTIQGVVKDLPLPNQLTGTKKSELFFCCQEEELLEMETTISLLLAPHTDIEDLNRKIAGLGITFNYKYTDLPSELGDEDYHFKVEGINAEKVGLHNFSEKMLLQSFGFLVLLSGLINFFSLSIGSFYNRTRELSMRKSIGANNRQLFGQLFTEQILTILLATFFALCLSETVLPWVIHLLDSITETGLYLDMGLFFREIAIILVELLAISAFIVGITIWRIHKIPGIRGMRGGNQTGSKHRVRNVMLGVGFFISLFFFGLASMSFLQNREMNTAIYSSCPKEEQERTFIVPLTAGQLKGIEQEVIRALTESPIVTEYLLTENSNLGNSEITGDFIFNKVKYLVYILKVSGNYPDFVHLPILRGQMPENPNQVLVNKRLSGYMEKEEMGNNLLLTEQNYTVSGVVEDISLLMAAEDGLFVIMPVQHPKYCYLRCQKGDEEKLMKHINQVMYKWIPDTLSVPVKTFYENLNEALYQLILLQNIFLILAVICIFITTSGIYAAITLDTEKRQKEVAIRKVNGATFKNIILLFGKLYIRIFCLGAIFCLPILWLLATTFQEEVQKRYDFNNPLFWFCLLAVTAGLIAITISSKLYRIARTNPAKTIKAE